MINEGLQLFEGVALKDDASPLSTMKRIRESNDWNSRRSDREEGFEEENERERELRSTERLLVLHSTLEIKELDNRRGIAVPRRCDFDDPTESALGVQREFLLERERRGGVFSTDIHYR